MERVTDLFPDTPAATRVWVTDDARKEMEMVPDDLLALLLARAEKGFQGYEGSSLRDEGGGVWAFGTQTWTVRIAGYFPWADRNHFVIGGVWKGKSGKNKGRPHSAEAVVNRILKLMAGKLDYDAPDTKPAR